jgi:glutaredoxin
MENEKGDASGFITKSIIMLSVLALAYFLYSASADTGSSPPAEGVAYDSTESPPHEFAECLTDSGAVFYGTSWCSHCNAQKELFGDAVSEVEFVDCDLSRDLCSMAGVTAFPTWVINGEKHVGTQPLQTLSDLTGCSLDA